MNPRIKFSHCWDKLSDPEFTTIRSDKPGKLSYYISQVGKQFTVLHVDNFYQARNGRLICYAYLRSVNMIPGPLIPDTILLKDVTLDGSPQIDWYEKIRKMDKAILLQFTKAPNSQLMLDISIMDIEEMIKE